ncbi:MAG: anti-sigma regulatory factor [Clostridiaceae bacterium]|nr:anti-sigma regulatory factor [Clostridiaceae bacterium]
MPDSITLHYEIDGKDFSAAGDASSSIKKVLSQLGVDPNTIRRVAISMYEAEINCVIHGGGGFADAIIAPDKIWIGITDHGPGIPDIDLAMQKGYTTATNEIREMGFGAGMGLPNIKSYSDDFNIKSSIGKGTTVEMTIYNRNDN